MKRSKFTESHIIFALKQAKIGAKVERVCRKMGICEVTFFNWGKKYSGLGLTELRKLRQHEDKNFSLNQIIADLTLDKQMLQDGLRKSLSDQPRNIFRIIRLLVSSSTILSKYLTFLIKGSSVSST